MRIFDHEPDLLGGLDDRTADVLRRRATVPRIWIEPGPWTAPPPADPGSAVGLLVLDGLMIRNLRLNGRTCPELLGPGDLVRPWDEPESSFACERDLIAHEATTLAVLDAEFAAWAGRWPTIFTGLLRRTTERTRSLAFSLAIAHMRRAEERLTTALWHLADRWGRVTPEGVHVPLRLTHEMLAQLTCVRRPTASTALSRLCSTGELARCPDGTWLLLGTPDGSKPAPMLTAA